MQAFEERPKCHFLFDSQCSQKKSPFDACSTVKQHPKCYFCFNSHCTLKMSPQCHFLLDSYCTVKKKHRSWAHSAQPTCVQSVIFFSTHTAHSRNVQCLILLRPLLSHFRLSVQVEKKVALPSSCLLLDEVPAQPRAKVHKPYYNYAHITVMTLALEVKSNFHEHSSSDQKLHPVGSVEESSVGDTTLVFI